MLFAIICMQMAFENLYMSIARAVKRPEFSPEDMKVYETLDKENEDLMDDLDLNTEDQNNELVVKKIKTFMKKFNDVIDYDENDGLSEEELKSLKEIFESSGITAVTDDTSVDYDQETWNARTRNRQIIKNINSKINSKYKMKCAVYQSNRDKDQWKFHYAAGYKYFWKEGLQFGLHYDMMTELSAETEQNLMQIKLIPEKKTTIDDLFRILEPAKLEDEFSFKREEWGYSKIISFETSDIDEISQKTFDEVSRILNAMKTNGCYDKF